MADHNLDDVAALLNELAPGLAEWQREIAYAVLESRPVHVSWGTGRSAGKWTAERWAMFTAHHFGQHSHFTAGNQYPNPPGICTAPTKACLEAGWTAYDPERMKP